MDDTANCFMCLDPLFTNTDLDHPLKVANLEVSTAILNQDWLFYRGTIVLVFKNHETELHHLSTAMQHKFMDDAAKISSALEKTYPNTKLNHGLLGNAMPHLHWHIVVRRQSDPNPRTTIWESDFPNVNLSEEQLREITQEIRQNL